VNHIDDRRQPFAKAAKKSKPNAENMAEKHTAAYGIYRTRVDAGRL
jgi:hypothetical protein